MWDKRYTLSRKIEAIIRLLMVLSFLNLESIIKSWKEAIKRGFTLILRGKSKNLIGLVCMLFWACFKCISIINRHYNKWRYISFSQDVHKH